MDLGLARAGWHHAFFCESDPHRRRVLMRHWPRVPVWENVHDVCGEQGGRVDLLCGGFPCQDLSVAGKRKGLSGEQSSLFFEFVRVADALVGPGGWILVENVPGLLSSNGGRDFAIVLATLAEFGFHDLAWRVLDSRYFGVPQRRRRVFIVGRRASGRRACEVLLEPESGGGNFEAGRGARARVAASLSRGSSSVGVSAPERRQEDDENIVADRYWIEDFENGTLTAAGQDGGPPRSDRNPITLCSPSDPDGVRTPPGDAGRVDDLNGTIASTLKRPTGGQHIEQDYILDRGRRGSVTPFDPKPDGPRYAACGDAVTVNVAEWIGRRILETA